MDEDLFPTPSDDDLERVRAVLRHIGGANVVWGAKDVLEVLLVERRMAADRRAANRLNRATWVLAVATSVLALATIALIWATLAD